MIGYGIPSIAIFNNLVIIETEQELGAASAGVISEYHTQDIRVYV